jgi:pimeloyl-ACP methyl ester carboxylesterase
MAISAWSMGHHGQVTPSDDDLHLLGGSRRASFVVLVLHGGREHGTESTSQFQTAYLRMLDFYAALRWSSSSTAVYLLRFRVRGWNSGKSVPDPVADARRALTVLTQRHPNAPIAVLGHSMGGRTAFAIADDPAVVGVCGLAPWLPTAEPLPGRIDGTSFVIAHGTADQTTSPALSLAYAERLRAASGRVARFELAGGKHSLLDHSGLWRRFAVRTTLGLVGQDPLPPAIATALASVSDDLRTPLAEGVASARL